jgi:hypothetical protein
MLTSKLRRSSAAERPSESTSIDRLEHPIGSIQPDYAIIGTAKLIEVSTGGDADAWLEFISRFHSTIAITAFRAARHWGGAHLQTIDHLIEKTYLELCADRGRILRQYRFEHEDRIRGLLQLVTVSVAEDYFRAL